MFTKYYTNNVHQNLSKTIHVNLRLKKKKEKRKLIPSSAITTPTTKHVLDLL